MSATTTELPAEPTFSPGSARPAWVEAISRPGTARIALIAIVMFGLLCMTRIIGDADGLTSSTTWGATLRLTVPIMLAGLAGIWAERVGVLNIGIEGMMILGSWSGAFGAWKWGPWVGIVMGILGGALGGLIHSVATVRFNVNHVISGVALNQLAFGAARYASQLAYVGNDSGGGISNSPPQKYALPKFSVPILAGGDLFGWKSPDVLGWLEKRKWFALGDLAGMIRGFMRDLSVASVFAFALVGLTSWILWRTTFGLRVRSSGEAPTAAESLGVKVNRVRYIALAISGGFAGLGGAYLSVVSNAAYRQGQTGSRGFIGMATMIFGNWRPSGVLGGATLFGFLDALQLVGSDSLTGMFLFVSFLAGVLLISSLVRRKLITSITAVIVGGLFLLAYLTVDKVPSSLTTSAPYLGTLIVLATASQRLRPPAMAGVPYRPGEGH